MPTLECHVRRRRQLLDATTNPILLMAGGFLPRNYPQNPFHFRADSNFLWLFGAAEPDSAAVLDPADGSVTLFLEPRTTEGALWHGEVPSFDEMKQRAGVDRIVPISDLAAEVGRIANGRTVDTLALADPRATETARNITGQDIDFFDEARFGPAGLIQIIANLRSQKAPEEIEAMRATAKVTHEAHLAAMAHTRPGGNEQELTGWVDGTFWRHGCVPAYTTILSVRGEVLHNHDHGNELRNGDIVLLDGGAEAASGFCSDVTRCWPVSGKFSPEAADIYDIVLASEKAGIAAATAGTRYRDVHMASSHVIAQGLVELGVMRGDPSDIVEAGAHAVFFPHGVGHQIGLDVHDMEAFGDAVHYPGRERSTKFGTCCLRMDRDLQDGMCFTIEPGIYFVPAIVHDANLREEFGEFVDYDKVEAYLKMNEGRGFGGIRIEDDVLCTATGPEVLTASIPKERGDVEAAVGTAI